MKDTKEDQRKAGMEFSGNPPNAFQNCRIRALLQINRALGGKNTLWPFRGNFRWSRRFPATTLECFGAKM